MAAIGPAAAQYAIIAGFWVDCTLRESHTFDSDVTNYPVESGSNITDNIRPLPLIVEMEGVVSNTPIGALVNQRAALSAMGVKPSDDCYDTFTRLWQTREPIQIVTSLRTYDNMAMKSLSFPRGDHEDGIKFNATFQQIFSVDNKREIRVSIPIASGGTGTGKTKVGKPTESFSGRTILIDKKLKAWWDPDLPGWRQYAKFQSMPITRDTGDAIITTYSAKKWLLYRSYPLNQTDTKLIPTPTSGLVSLKVPTSQSELEDQVESRWKQIIAVPASACVFNGFTIQKPPGGIAQKDLYPVRPR